MTAADRAAWSRLHGQGAPPVNPLTGPAFAELVGRFRSDALVSIWRADDDGRAIAFLPHHRRGGVAFPIGAPLSDYHGVIAEPGFDLAEGLRLAGLNAYRFTGLIAEPDADGGREGFLVELTDGPEAYLEGLRQARPKNFKNFRRLGHKLEREVGALRVETTPNRAAFDTLIDWKRRQLSRTGGYDFLRTAWVSDLLSALHDNADPAFGGLMINLYAGDRLVAGHFGLRTGPTYHPWIASTDPELAELAPGHVFLMQAIATMPAVGLATYDLGPDHDHYKRLYAQTWRTVTSGSALAGGALLAAPGHGDDAGLVSRLRRRMDVISMSEPTVLGRFQGYADTAGIVARKILPLKDVA